MHFLATAQIMIMPNILEGGRCQEEAGGNCNSLKTIGYCTHGQTGNSRSNDPDYHSCQAVLRCEGSCWCWWGARLWPERWRLGWRPGRGQRIAQKSKIARVIGWPSPQLSNYETASRTLSVAIVRPCVSVAPYSNAEAMCSGLLL